VSAKNSVKPDTHAWVIPFVTVEDPAKSLSFYASAFGFKQDYANEQGGKIVHAEMSYMDQTVLLITAEGMNEHEIKTPKHSKTPPATIIFVYIKGVDEAYSRAQSLGGKGVHAPMDVPWGERHCHIEDPDGHRWQLSELIEEKS
jgi:uncharacterized glyoxalase superfamily protein PhnB